MKLIEDISVLSSKENETNVPISMYWIYHYKKKIYYVYIAPKTKMETIGKCLEKAINMKYNGQQLIKLKLFYEAMNFNENIKCYGWHIESAEKTLFLIKNFFPLFFIPKKRVFQKTRNISN